MIGLITLQLPATAAEQLILLFHGVDSTPESLVPLGKVLAAAFPAAAVFSVQSPDPGDRGTGFQWFSLRGITNSNRMQRVAEAMSRFLETVRVLQARTGTRPSQTVIVGFSQGGIMALEASQVATPPAASIVGIAARFASMPHRVPAATSVHLIHGDADTLISVEHARAACDALLHIGAAVSIDIIPSLGHRIDDRASARLVARLKDLAEAP